MGVFTLQSAYTDASYRRRQDRREIPQSFTVGLRHGPQLRNALLTERGVNEFLVSNMAAYNAQELDFDRLPIPFRCVATDLNTLQPVTFNHGPLPQAVRASISIPGVFSPVQGNDGHYLVDGGILDNLPTDVVRHDLHADIVIAIHLESAPISPGDTSSIVGVLNRAFTAGIEQNVERAKLLADVVISVPLDDFSGTDYDKGGQLIRAGYLAAEQNSAALLRYALDDKDWNAYLAARKARILPPPGALRKVHVEGGSPSADKSVLADMKPLEGPADHVRLRRSTRSSRSSPTAATAPLTRFSQRHRPAGSTALRTPGGAPDDAGILVRLTKDTDWAAVPDHRSGDGGGDLEHHAHGVESARGRSEPGRVWI